VVGRRTRLHLVWINRAAGRIYLPEWRPRTGEEESSLLKKLLYAREFDNRQRILGCKRIVAPACADREGRAAENSRPDRFHKGVWAALQTPVVSGESAKTPALDLAFEITRQIQSASP